MNDIHILNALKYKNIIKKRAFSFLGLLAVKENRENQKKVREKMVKKNWEKSGNREIY